MKGNWNKLEKFWAYVEKTESCWLWRGQLLNTGYGDMRWHKRRLRPHRFSYEISLGKIPQGLCVMHLCDVPACVRPDHLKLGTRGENNTDRKQKDRSFHPRGELSPSAKLSWEIVSEIRNLKTKNPQITFVEVAKQFNVSESTIRAIFYEKTWKYEKKEAINDVLQMNKT